VIVRFCDNYGFSDSTRPLTDPRNERPRKLFDDWCRSMSLQPAANERHQSSHEERRGGTDWKSLRQGQLGVWDYWRVFSQHPPGFLAPNANVRALGRDIPFFKGSGVDLVTVECEDLFGAGLNADPVSADLQSFMPLRTWVGMKLLDRPNDDVSALVDRFCTGYYGPAAKPMRALLDRIESRQAETPTRIVDVQRHVWAEQLCDAAFFADAYRLLDEATRSMGFQPVPPAANERHQSSPEERKGGTDWRSMLPRVCRERIIIDSTFLWLEEHVRRQNSSLSKSFPSRADVLARHRADWDTYLASVFNAEGLKITKPIIDCGITLAEKLRPEETRFEEAAIRCDEATIKLDGQLTEPFWEQADTARLVPRDPTLPFDNPAIVRFAWTDEALYVGIEQPLDRPVATIGVALQAADRQGIQLTLYAPQREGELPLNAYFYRYDETGNGLQAVPGRKAQCQSFGHCSDKSLTTELRFRWSDIDAAPKAADRPSNRRFLVNIESYPQPGSQAASHHLSPWLLGTSPPWHSGYFKSLRLGE
jgi:hypothetical protein